MDEIFKFTKSELVAALTTYNTTYLENPQDFGVIENAETSADAQADMLIEILKKQKND